MMLVKHGLRDKIDGHILSILGQLNNSNGYRFDPNQLERALRNLVDGDFGSAKSPTLFYYPHLISEDNLEDWEVVEDVEPNDRLNVARLKFRQCLNPSELGKLFGSWVYGPEMRARAINCNGNLGLSDAPHILAGQKDIPAEMRHYIIVLPGTLVRHRVEKDNYVFFLRHDGKRWILDKDLLSAKWTKRAYFACI